MDIYYIALACWLSGAFLSGLWSPRIPDAPATGFYELRGPKSHARIELHYLPTLSGIPNRVPLYQHADTWRYRVPGGPWVYPSWSELIAHAQNENGDPLIEE